jgi:hypothetical protein
MKMLYRTIEQSKYCHPDGNFRWDVLLWQVQSEAIQAKRHWKVGHVH